MTDRKHPDLNKPASGDHDSNRPCSAGAGICPGLTKSHARLKQLAEAVSKGICARDFKKITPVLWVTVAGGTGTGKSTLFNVLCGETLSASGFERPSTVGPVAYAHESFSVPPAAARILPKVAEISCDIGNCVPTPGLPGRLTMLTHRRETLRHMVLVDTPDLDSVDHAGKGIADDLAMPADFVIFVSSQEKYADLAPAGFLRKVVEEGVPCLFLLNKAAPETVAEEIRDSLAEHGIEIPLNRILKIPYGMPQDGPVEGGFKLAAEVFFEECSPAHVEFLKAGSTERIERFLSWSAREAIEIIEDEKTGSSQWLDKLSALHTEGCNEFLRLEEARLTADRTRHLRAEVRKLFSRYDLLAGPRRLIQSILVFPLRLVGIKPAPGAGDRQNDLASMRGRLNLGPLFAALENFNRRVLQDLSPSDPSAPLYRGLRENTSVSESEAAEMVERAQRELEQWLTSTFEELERSLPRSRKWGIYTTAVMWGILVLSLETALGGGFTVVDAAVGSALTPFATKGALELFALKEVQRIARELALRLRKGLLSVLDEQKTRYERCLMSLMPPEAVVGALKKLAFEPAGGGDPFYGMKPGAMN